MLQTITIHRGLEELIEFQVPKGMLQTVITNIDICNFNIVSSPQGNATNKMVDGEEYVEFLVSSPQGNATNSGSPLAFILPNFWFQVPKGMLQTKYSEILSKFKELQFQVPKGMLQTYMF